MWKSRTGINTPRNKIPQPEWKRWHVIEDLIKTRGWTRGIELGVKNGKNWLKVLKSLKSGRITLRNFENGDTHCCVVLLNFVRRPNILEKGVPPPKKDASICGLFGRFLFVFGDFWSRAKKGVKK